LQFVTAGKTVTTDSNTRFNGGDCKEIDDGDKVEVEGVLKADGTVNADRVRIKK
jgi:hypothetical protein